MKKKYEKPLIAVESFQLDAAIAGDCAESGYNVLGYSMNTCTTTVNGELYFGPQCEAGGVDIVGAGGITCYQASSYVYELKNYPFFRS